MLKRNVCRLPRQRTRRGWQIQDPAEVDRRALIDLARCTTFSIRRGPRDAYPRVWVQETVPRHGYREAPLQGAVDDWTEVLGARHLAHQILCHVQELGLITEAQRVRIWDVFALEVVRNLKTRFRMTALQIVLWMRRDLTGVELVRETEAAAE